MIEIRDSAYEAAAGMLECLLPRIIYAHREAAEKAERDRIVAWLRDCSLSSAIPDDPAHIIADLANTIERGEHLK